MTNSKPNNKLIEMKTIADDIIDDSDLSNGDQVELVTADGDIIYATYEDGVFYDTDGFAFYLENILSYSKLTNDDE